MNGRNVIGVLIVKFTRSNYKALYGRLDNDTTYTKDYIQIPAAVSSELRKVIENGGGGVDVEYAWPGGGRQAGRFHWSTDRYHLKWDTNDPPPPWTLGNVGPDSVASLNGDRSLRTAVDGDRQLEEIEEAGHKPWLLAIILAGEHRRFHLRVYFEIPPNDLEDRGINQLPEVLQRAIHDLDESSLGTAFVYLGNGIPAMSASIRAKKLVTAIRRALSRDPNVLLIGPPGTGKTVALEDLRLLYSSETPTTSVLFDPENWRGNWTDLNESPAKCISLTFHASYLYENFVAGLFPKSSEGGIELEAVPGPLLCISHWVGASDRRGLLILDEFNRGSAAAIFGDTLSLLDKEKRSSTKNTGTQILRPFSGHAMPVPASFRQDAAELEQIAPEIGIPVNVHIVAAMNSTDRSVAPLDAALRRRFSLIRVLPDYELLAQQLGINIERAELPLPTSRIAEEWGVEDISALAIKLLRCLNERIEFFLGEDFLLGHGLLWSLAANAAIDRLSELAYCVDSRVIATLRMTFVDQDDALAGVLGIAEDLRVKSATTELPKDTVAYWRDPPAGLASLTSSRLVLQPVQKMHANDQIVALAAIASRS